MQRTQCWSKGRVKHAGSPSRRPRNSPLALQVLEPRLALDATGRGSLARSARVDVVAPSIEAIRIVPPEGDGFFGATPVRTAYAAGDRLTFRVTFTEPVMVSGRPTLPVAIGGVTHDAASTGASRRSRFVTFALTLTEDVGDARGVRVAGPIGLPNGASIRDAAGHPAERAASEDFPGVVIDATGPRVTRFSEPIVSARGRVTLDVTFDGPVRVTGAPIIPFSVLGVPRRLEYVAGSGSRTLRFAYAPRPGERPSDSTVALPEAPAVVLPGGASLVDRLGNRPRSLASPTAIMLTAAGASENNDIGALVGTFSASDPDGNGDLIAYELVPGVGADDNSLFRISGRRLEATTIFDYERRATYSIRVRATDSGGLAIETVFPVVVADANEPPTAVTLVNPLATLPENTSTERRVRVADINVTDDALGTATVTLSGPDSGSFEADGGVIYLKAGTALDFATKRSYSVAVQVADAAASAAPPVTTDFTLGLIDASPYTDAIARAIRDMETRTGSETSEGLLWSVTDGNALRGLGTEQPEWLLPTHDAWGAVTAHDSSRAQNHLLASITSIIANAEKVVDISSLTKVADGDFRRAIVAGATQAYQAGRSPIIRLLWGRTPLSVVDGDAAALRSLQREIHEAAPGLSVVAALMDDVSAVPLQVSWNHSKIVAADGRVALVGGINMWSADYLQSRDPVTDLAIEVEGPAAFAAHSFLDTLWRYCWTERDHIGVSIDSFLAPGVAFPATVTSLIEPSRPVGGVRVLAVGRAGHVFTGRVTGTIDDHAVSAEDQDASRVVGLPNPMNGNAAWDGNNPSDTALRTLIDLAQTEIVISQQQMEFPSPGAVVGQLPHFDVRLFDALARRAIAGVKITIVVSGTITGAYSAFPALTMRVLTSRLEKLLGSRDRAVEVGASQVTIAPFRFSEGSGWPGTGVLFVDRPRLHSKIISVDRAVSYVGSQNAYPNELMEFGFIVEDPAAVADLERTYLDPMVRYSSAAALSWST